MGQFYSLLWDACGFWSLTNCGCGLQKKKKKPHPAWVFLRKMPEKQLILFAWPNGKIIPIAAPSEHAQTPAALDRKVLIIIIQPSITYSKCAGAN